MVRSARSLSLLLMVALSTGAFADMVAYYPFNEGKGTTTADATGNGNNGTLSSGVQWVTGQKGSAVRFAAAGDRIVTTGLNPSGKNNAMTLAAWIKWEGQGGSISQQGIIGKRAGWNPGTGIKWFWQTNPTGDLLFRCDTGDAAMPGGSLWWGNARLAPYANKWAHVAVTWDNGTAVQYVNGKETDRGTVALGGATANGTLVAIGCVDSGNTESFMGSIDEVRIYDTALAPSGIAQAMTGDTTTASTPQPATGATDVPRDAVLSWTAGDSAAGHDVYFGTDPNAVSAASRTDDRGVLASSGQSGTSYDPHVLLAFGQTYYWRVDEVNAPPSTAVHKGPVWSFTVEPYSYPVTNITATASSTQTGSSAQAVVNGSGLDAGGLHGNDGTTMWLSTGTPSPSWIQFQFDNTYKLDKMLVWNYNQAVETLLGFGAKDVTVEYSTDGTTWTAVANVPQFAQGPGLAGYAANTTVDMGGALAKYVKLTVNKNWGGMVPQTGLSEVQFTYVPVVARAPQPANNATGVSLSASLDWRPGRDVTSQKVYLGTDKTAVANGTVAAQTVTNHGLTPASLTFGTNYYWKVDEVGATTTYPGPVWKFTTQEWAVVDDFESYNQDQNRIYDSWIDGSTDGKSNSYVGYNPTATELAAGAAFAETTIVHGGKQSMPVDYNNIKSPYYSEATRTFATTQDWTANGADTLSLWFEGRAAAFADNGDGSYTMSGSGTDVWNNSDQFRFVYKSLSGDGSLVVRVDSVANTNGWAKAGVMIRQSIDPASTHAFMPITAGGSGAGNGASFQRRLTVGGASSNDDKPAPAIGTPYWVKITRVGNALSGYIAPDGKTWTQLGTAQTIVMTNPVLIGLAVCSHDATKTTVAQFSNLSQTGNITGSWQVAAIGMAMPTNEAAPLYLTVQDKAGKSKTVVNPDPAASLAASWTQWRIPLSSLTGVNLTAVNHLVLGVGDKSSPKAGGAGRMYFDDIVFGKSLTPIGLVANYPFENDVKDVSGNGHDGTLVGTPTYVTGAPGHGTGMLFPGTTNNMVSLGTFNPSEQTGMLSVSLWAKWNGLTSYYQGLIGKRNTWAADQTMWQLEANLTSGALSFSRYGAAGSAGAPVLTIGQWTHIAVTFDKTTTQFYLNGAKAGTANSAFTFGPNLDAAVVIGNDDGGGGNPFNGALDEVRLYDYALTPAEVLTLAK